ncbi:MULTISPECIES: phage tail assembly chaperone [Sphingomonas]|uniref:Phage tail assembly chaperone n=1 Tax=Edaphosphingomonas fennica TaxID=114404 RepID=A0A2T4HMD1_9SPHN|nr:MULTISPECIES: phage tail assembly chaperone [Sphingomonas]AGH51140.1 hypothetical protein G432_17110 [Sphingomonas sp. MM-1]MDX3885468.1 phage tail assembly chaperone [Sphingomonas sp.]PTD16973.1 phage tail assembly chaperone [Sphingomonas fennica]
MMRFAEKAARLAGMAGAIAGWRPDDFWRATPAELAAVLEALAGGSGDRAADAGDIARLKEMYPDG